MRQRVLPLLFLAACSGPADPVDDVPASDPGTMDEALLRDFRKNAKLDEGGHPINARVFEAERFCTGQGQVVAGGYRSTKKSGTVCSGKLDHLPWGDQIVNIKLRPVGVDLGSKKQVLKVTLDATDAKSVTWSGKSFRKDGQWTYLPVQITANGNQSAELKIETMGRGAIEIDYIEVFPDSFPMALGPGSRVLADDAEITVEGPLGGMTPILTIDGKDAHLDDLLHSGGATRIDTGYRAVYTTTVARLAAGRTGDLDVFARDPKDELPTARMRIYRQAPPCMFEGDPKGTRVLITGFQPFPVAEVHPNVSDVAIHALDVAELVGAQVMRLELPVEYDEAPAIVTDVIARCTPDVVIDFGQGAGDISLEQTAYNLKDTGSAVDNRGLFQAGIPIDDDGPPTLLSGLPVDRIQMMLEAMPISEVIGRQRAVLGTDPGRYICNNTFYAAVAAAAAIDPAIRAGFVHLPYTIDFNEQQRQAWGEIIRVVVQTSVDRVTK
jgi:pyroglutamyl-peptidase